MSADIHYILSNFKHLAVEPDLESRLTLGESFANNPVIRKMNMLLEEYDLSKRSVSGAHKGILKPKSLVPLSKKAKFYLFLLMMNRHFDSKKNKLVAGSEEQLKLLSDDFKIDVLEYNSLLKFYSSDKPYHDNVDCAYMAFEYSSQLIRAKCMHVYFNHKNPGEIVYLKYFKSYNLFLSKTFTVTRSYNSLAEELSVKDINIIDEKNYETFNHRIPSFKNLKLEIKKFDPLQYVEVSETSYNPQITLDPVKCIISVSGSSSPVSTTSYFEPVFEWLKVFDASNKKTLSVYLDFKYFNTYTAKFLVNLVKECNLISLNGKKVSFYWYYDDDDDEMKEFGEDLQLQFTEKEKFYVLENNTVI